jgi:hypothetical protein
LPIGVRFLSFFAAFVGRLFAFCVEGARRPVISARCRAPLIIDKGSAAHNSRAVWEGPQSDWGGNSALPDQQTRCNLIDTYNAKSMFVPNG